MSSETETWRYPHTKWCRLFHQMICNSDICSSPTSTSSRSLCFVMRRTSENAQVWCLENHNCECKKTWNRLRRLLQWHGRYLVWCSRLKNLQRGTVRSMVSPDALSSLPSCPPKTPVLTHGVSAPYGKKLHMHDWHCMMGCRRGWLKKSTYKVCFRRSYCHQGPFYEIYRSQKFAWYNSFNTSEHKQQWTRERSNVDPGAMPKAVWWDIVSLTGPTQYVGELYTKTWRPLRPLQLLLTESGVQW